ncbi:MAG TPA: hypothetical protein PKL31_05640 [Fulvivirga sp.]|nr:hypothetical protein [Fulvivirga sp.]
MIDLFQDVKVVDALPTKILFKVMLMLSFEETEFNLQNILL